MDLKMEVYTPALELIGILEICRSVIFEDCAFTAGSFSVESLITDESVKLLVPENIIWITDDIAGIIENVQEQVDDEGPYITVKGQLLTGILSRRILWGAYKINASPAAIMRQLVQDCAISPTRGDITARKIPRLVLEQETATGQSIRYQKTGGGLLEALEELGETNQIAFGVRFNPEIPQMEFWTRPGINRSVNQHTIDPVFYSTELDDVLSSEYTYDSMGYKNVALVAGEGEGVDRKFTVVEQEAEPVPEPPTPPEPPGTTYTITLSVDPENGGTAAGGGTVNAGTAVTVTATPSNGYEFTAWTENGETVSVDTTYMFTVSANHSLTAVFSIIIPTYTITVIVNDTAWGTVSGAGKYKQGETVTLSASPKEGYQFTAWTENGKELSINETLSFTANSNRTISAAFEEETHGLVFEKTIAPLQNAKSEIASALAGNYAVIDSNGRFDAYNSSLTHTAIAQLGTTRIRCAGASTGNYAVFMGGWKSGVLAALNTIDSALTYKALSFTTKNSDLAATSFAGYAIFGGGYGKLTIVIAYDNALTRRNPTVLSTGRQNLAAASIDNYAIFGGGVGSAVVDAYDSALTRTIPTALSQARGRISATSVDNHVLFAGGYYRQTTNVKDVVDAYDDSLTRTTPTALSVARSYIEAATLDGYAIFAGGYNGGDSLASVDTYDTALVRTVPLELNPGRRGGTAIAIGNHMLLAGGYSTASLNTVDSFTIK